MTGLAWSLAIYAVAVTLSAQLVTAQTPPVVPANTEYDNNGQATGTYEGLNPTASVISDGFDDSDKGANPKNASWISSNSHWVIILVLCLLVLSALIYYISKSIRGVRKKMLKGDQDGLPLQNRGGYTAPYEQHMNESIHPPPMYSYEPPKYDQAVRY
ncbi:hypothetical protein INT44_006370 [Umbelopsis vinacea]|uniref:Uncharacterized protein n=1 Tax=Umbelopsis vinacea TaxID=44442 RepID=A0A8H7PST0_9FUNG|nr:hypothetical protein INT44_006370 [Umbelopsis vinacea]KAI9286384.1 hypothetical protein BC943DRAFT_359546 [Umbelopsis sp. AD052]